MRITHIAYSSHFKRAIKWLGKEQADIIREREEIFKTDCFDPRLKTHKLHGKLNGYYSFSITHSHRILFEFLDDHSVGFLDIGDHSMYD